MINKTYNETINAYDYRISNPYTGMDMLAFRIYRNDDAGFVLVYFAGAFGEQDDTEITEIMDGCYETISEAENRAIQLLKIPNHQTI